MIKVFLLILIFLVIVLVAGFFIFEGFTSSETVSVKETVSLPTPQYKGDISLEEAIYRRKSERTYADEPLALEEISQILWAAAGKVVDGVTGPTRAYPSAGGIYPLDVYLVAGKIQGLKAGIYIYNWRQHSIDLIVEGDKRQELTNAALGQRMINQAPASLVFTADYPSTTSRYGSRGKTRYVPMDAGGASQNVYLQAAALNLNTVAIGAFRDTAVKQVLGGIKEEPLYIMPVGRKP